MPDNVQAYIIRLHQILSGFFDEDELQTLCFYLGMDYENLRGETKAGKARELIRRLTNRGRVAELIEVGKQLRPNISWPHLSVDISEPDHKKSQRVSASQYARRSESTIRVLIVDDHPAARAGIQQALATAPEIEVVGEASDGETVWELIQALSPDVVIVDCRLGEVNGVAVAERIQADGYAARVLALSAHDDDRYVYGMLHAQTAGYVLKHESLKNIVEAVRTVAEGGEWYSQKIMRRVAAWARGEQPDLTGLTERELHVLRLVAQGWEDQRIAETLNITEETVKNHVTDLCDKLGLHTRIGMVAWVWQRGLMDSG